MRKSIGTLAFAALLALGGALAAQGRGLAIEVRGGDGNRLGGFSGSYALVVGESEYAAGWPKLPGTRSDVDAVSAALKESGFAVTVQKDLSFEQLKKCYDDFIDAHGIEDGNRLLFYYAGHGHTLKLGDGRDMGYIVPVDAPNPSLDLAGFKRKALAMQQFDTWAKRIESRHALFLFDSCFSGSIFNTTRAAPDNINEKTLKPVRQFITSGSADEQVPDRSIFREQFLVGIGGEADRNGDGYVTGAELGEFLDEKVVNYSHKGQHPQVGKIQDPNLDKGDFVFVAKVAAPVRPAAVGSAKPAMPLLMISSSRPALVYVDGALKGQTEADAVLTFGLIPPGQRKLRLVYGEGDEESSSVAIQAGKTAVLSFSKSAPPPAKGAKDYVVGYIGSQAEGVKVPDFFFLDPIEMEALPQFKGYAVFKDEAEGPSLYEARAVLASREKAMSDIQRLLSRRVKDTIAGAMVGDKYKAESYLERAYKAMTDTGSNVWREASVKPNGLKVEECWTASCLSRPGGQKYRVIRVTAVDKEVIKKQAEKILNGALEEHPKLDPQIMKDFLDGI